MVSLADTQDTAEGFQAYLNDCNSVCAHKQDAEAKILSFQEAQDDAAWSVVQQSGSAQDARNYLENCGPTCAHSAKAQRILNDAKALQQNQNEAVFGALLLGFAIPLAEPNIMLLMSPQIIILLPVLW